MEIQEFVNRGIGAPMIQHGEQFLVQHEDQDEPVYVFYPNGYAYRFSGKAESIQEIFEVVLKVGVETT